MTALYAILAVICLGGVLMGAYLIGFDDGVKAERMRRRTLDYILQEIIKETQEIIKETPAKENDRHALTHADMVQLEAAARNREEAEDEEEK